MNRRDFLKVCNKFGVSYATLPLLGALPSLSHAVGPTATPRGDKRFLTVYHPHGMHQPSWSCGEGSRQGDDWSLSSVLAPLQGVKEKTNVIEGVSAYKNSHPGRHQQGMTGLLTGGELFQEGFSIDQLLADHWNTKSLYLGVQSVLGPFGYPNHRISYRGNLEAGSQESNSNPFSVFNQTFAGLADSSIDRFATNKSVLDAVLEEVNSVKRRLSAEDTRLLDQHQTNIRELECRLHGTYCDNDLAQQPAAASCQPPSFISQPSNLDAYLQHGPNFPVIAKLQADIAVTALACSINPVIVLQYSFTENTNVYSWVTNEDGNPATSGDHHNLSHFIYSSASARKDFNAIHRWYAEQVAYIAGKLDDITEENGTVLDNTLIYWGTCLGSPQNHWHRNWPSVLVGNVDGFFKTNQSLDFRANPNGPCYNDPVNCFRDQIANVSQTDLLNTMAAALGMGATDDTPVVGNINGPVTDGSHVNNAYHGLIRELMA